MTLARQLDSSQRESAREVVKINQIPESVALSVSFPKENLTLKFDKFKLSMRCFHFTFKTHLKVLLRYIQT